MASIGLPAFHTQSKRNLFADEPSSPPSTPVSPQNREDDIVFSTDLAGIDVAPAPVATATPSKSPSPSKGKKSTSPKKKSPFKKFLKKTPEKGCVADEACLSSPGFFTKLYYSLAGYNENGVYRPAPVAKGVYFDFQKIPSSSVSTLDTNQDGHNEQVHEWVASNLDDHVRGVPGLVRRPEYEEYDEVDDRKLLKKIIAKAKKLPQEPGKYASIHVMVNAERAKRMVPPMRRERHLDQIAREQAKIMAEEQNLFHIGSPNDLKKRMKELDAESRELPEFQRMGTNIGRGKSIEEAHRFMMAALAERNNINDKRFFYMGMGTSIAENGQLYMCQVFGG